MTDDLDADTLAFAHRMFDLARDGAVFRKNTEAVRALLDAGADPDHGSPSAVEIARFFDLPELLAALDRS